MFKRCRMALESVFEAKRRVDWLLSESSYIFSTAYEIRNNALWLYNRDASSHHNFPAGAGGPGLQGPHVDGPDATAEAARSSSSMNDDPNSDFTPRDTANTDLLFEEHINLPQPVRSSAFLFNVGDYLSLGFGIGEAWTVVYNMPVAFWATLLLLVMLVINVGRVFVFHAVDSIIHHFGVVGVILLSSTSWVTWPQFLKTVLRALRSVDTIVERRLRTLTVCDVPVKLHAVAAGHGGASGAAVSVRKKGPRAAAGGEHDAAAGEVKQKSETRGDAASPSTAVVSPQRLLDVALGKITGGLSAAASSTHTSATQSPTTPSSPDVHGSGLKAASSSSSPQQQTASSRGASKVVSTPSGGSNVEDKTKGGTEPPLLQNHRPRPEPLLSKHDVHDFFFDRLMPLGIRFRVSEMLVSRPDAAECDVQFSDGDVQTVLRACAAHEVTTWGSYATIHGRQVRLRPKLGEVTSGVEYFTHFLCYLYNAFETRYWIQLTLSVYISLAMIELLLPRALGTLREAVKAVDLIEVDWVVVMANGLLLSLIVSFCGYQSWADSKDVHSHLAKLHRRMSTR
eukprot:g6188.t1